MKFRWRLWRDKHLIRRAEQAAKSGNYKDLFGLRKQLEAIKQCPRSQWCYDRAKLLLREIRFRSENTIKGNR